MTLLFSFHIARSSDPQLFPASFHHGFRTKSRTNTREHQQGRSHLQEALPDVPRHDRHGRRPGRKAAQSETIQFSRQGKDGRRDRRAPSERNHEGKGPDAAFRTQVERKRAMDGAALYSDVREVGIHGPRWDSEATAETLRAFLANLTMTMGLTLSCQVGKTDWWRMRADVDEIPLRILCPISPNLFSAFWISSLNF